MGHTSWRSSHLKSPRRFTDALPRVTHQCLPNCSTCTETSPFGPENIVKSCKTSRGGCEIPRLPLGQKSCKQTFWRFFFGHEKLACLESDKVDAYQILKNRRTRKKDLELCGLGHDCEFCTLVLTPADRFGSQMEMIGSSVPSSGKESTDPLAAQNQLHLNFSF